MKKILLLNGPNLNMLGKREPEIYGSQTLVDIERHLQQLGKEQGVELDYFQSNSEEALINRIHQAFQQVDFILFNPAAFTHTSVALRDAILSVDIPFVEIHLSNVHSREEFRHYSYFSDIAQAVICGCGVKGYEYGLDFAVQQLAE
ncbi:MULTISPECIES: type II 3-dehydroquinate dehydratase [Pasteurellaceae]|uniref:3-dehydroquinate dehydratase n=1 Tax=Pasteurella atlantica TaxID=2827233 RepID=A0AAW8CNH0_9PAST|nr:type II 3-dehydroquinate dehydratase [Pasteurella atlantica]MBR0573111.1 type II 3-dehydroquinate dehydratase [Pasteurella atlantica]MDP8039032.1 type II 3-dehydroquinate dehydratase [Pasteurella atlantica]MDP8041122.1 type II 3-dehydroquinate dehydratase [Pasteurella atlantica]MDP8043265.1 type II 3-dehydroquinate dehydratase [Pasteurella atlantica]MDP8045351.1 type II 3-dehydroquinate dehydratase [Pasteurella atlantica]